MTNQEAFDRVVTHLRLQGRQSSNGLTCYYRSPNGLRCAVGVLITDEFYRPEMEGRTINDLLMAVYISKALPGVSIGLLHQLQSIHDNQWKNREALWKALAEEWGLTMPPVPVETTVHEAEHALA